MTTAAFSAAQFYDEVQQAKKALDELAREYAVCEERAFSSQTTDQAHVASGPSNQPFALADAHRKLRSELRFSSEFLRLFIYGKRDPNRFLGLLDQLDVLRSRLEGDEQRHGAAFDAIKYPRTAYKDDVESSVSAQEQRRKQGDIHTGENEPARQKLGLPDLEQEFRRGVR